MKSRLFRSIAIILLVLASCLGTFLTLDAFGLVNLTKKTELIVELNNATKEYSNTPLYPGNASSDTEMFGPNNSVLPKGFIYEGELEEKHTIVVKYDNYIVNAGTALSSATVNVIDETGKDKTKDYDITIIPAQLTVTKTTISVYCSDNKMTYDGSSLTPTNFIVNGHVAEGHKVCYEFTPNNNVDLFETGTLSISVVNQLGFEVTSNYNLVYDSQISVEIIPRELEITMFPKSKTYDGMKLDINQNDFMISNGSLADGDKIVYTPYIEDDSGIVNEMLNAGEYKVTFKVTITNKKNEDVTSFYTYNEDDEFIYEIKKIVKIIDIPTISKTYDGESLMDVLENEMEYYSGLNNIDIGLSDAAKTKVDGYINVKFESGAIRPLSLTSSDFVVDDSNKNAEYDIRCNLLIEQAEIIVTLKDISKNYDGEKFDVKLITDNMTVADEDGKISNWDEIFEVSEKPEEINATKEPIEYDFKLEEKSGDHNYKIEYNRAKLFIKKLEISIDIKDSDISKSIYKGLYDSQVDVYSTDDAFIPVFVMSGDYAKIEFTTKKIVEGSLEDKYLISVDKVKFSTTGNELTNYIIKPQLDFSNLNTEIAKTYIDALKGNLVEKPSIKSINQIDELPSSPTSQDYEHYIDYLEANQKYTNVDVITRTGNITFVSNIEAKNYFLNVKLVDLEKEFDGLPFTEEDIYETAICTWNDNEAIDKYDVEFSFTSKDFKITSGKVEYTVICNVFDKETREVAQNVSVTIEAAKYEIKKRTVYFRLFDEDPYFLINGVQKAYDGKELLISSKYIQLYSFIDGLETVFNYSENDLFISEVMQDKKPKEATKTDLLILDKIEVVGISISSTRTDEDVSYCFDIYADTNKDLCKIPYKIIQPSVFYKLKDYTIDLNHLRSIYENQSQFYQSIVQNIGFDIVDIVQANFTEGDYIEKIILLITKDDEQTELTGLISNLDDVEIGTYDYLMATIGIFSSKDGTEKTDLYNSQAVYVGKLHIIDTGV